MQEIPAVFWMAIITALTVMLGLIMFYVAMLAKESASTVAAARDVVKEAKITVTNANHIIAEAAEIVAAARGIVTSVQGIVSEVNLNVVSPMRKVGGTLNSIAAFVNGIKGR